MAVQLFPADGVTWVVSLPTGPAAETIWPDMEWIQAFVLAQLPAEDDRADTQALKEVQAA